MYVCITQENMGLGSLQNHFITYYRSPNISRKAYCPLDRYVPFLPQAQDNLTPFVCPSWRVLARVCKNIHGSQDYARKGKKTNKVDSTLCLCTQDLGCFLAIHVLGKDFDWCVTSGMTCSLVHVALIRFAVESMSGISWHVLLGTWQKLNCKQAVCKTWQRPVECLAWKPLECILICLSQGQVEIFLPVPDRQ